MKTISCTTNTTNATNCTAHCRSEWLGSTESQAYTACADPFHSGECFYPERVKALIAKFVVEQASWTLAERASYVGGMEGVRDWYNNDLAALVRGGVSDDFELQVCWETAVRQGILDRATAMDLYPPLSR